MTARELQPCGTRAAYVRHRAAGEEACQPCKDANAEHHRNNTRPRMAAYTRLAALYPDDFARFLAEEQAAEGITTEVPAP